MTAPHATGFELTRAVASLRRTPMVIAALVDGLDEAMTHANEGGETFSPFDNIGHLIDGEETDWMARARIILARGDDPVFAPYDRFRHRARNVGRTLESLVSEFAMLRERNLAELESWQLTERELALPGRHPAFGAVTLRELLATWVVHDLGHIAQIARVLAKQYAADIGPWRAYLPIVTDRSTPG